MTWARAEGIFGRRGAAQRRGTHLCKPPVRSKTREQRDVACKPARSQRRAQQRPATPRRRAQSRRGARSARRATRRCKRRIVRTVCDLGTHRGHLRTPRRGATTPPHLREPPPRATEAKKTWGGARRDHNVARNNAP